MNKTTTIRNSGITAGDTAKTADKAGKYRLAKGGLLALLCLSAIAVPANAQTDGIMMLQNLTIPRGGVWLNDASGGHWWQTDSVLGICRMDPAPAQTPPWQLTNCAGFVKAGGQALVTNVGPGYAGPPLPAGAKFVFVADAGSGTEEVARWVFNPAGSGGLSSPLMLQAPTVAAAHGGVRGARASGVVLAPNGLDIFVGYLKSGDIMKVANATTTMSQTPVVTQIGETSDGIGTQSLVMHRGDLYLAEMGGFGLSRIQDPAGVTRAACNPTAVCTAMNLSPTVSSFPGGLASDGTYLYVGDAPRTTPGSILRYDPATLTVITYSAHVPLYTSNFDGVQRTTYANPFGLALGPNNDLYVADDPTGGLVLPVLPTLQGHLWRVPAVSAPPTVTNLSLTQGAMGGGDVVTVTGTGFSVGLGATQIMFGTAPAIMPGPCTPTSCIVTTPSSTGPGVVDVRAWVGGVGSPIVPADQFTYLPNSLPGAPVITNVNPKSGVVGGGTVVTITGSNLQGGFVTFGVNPATSVTCTVDGLSCTATSPAGAAGTTVDVAVTNALALTSAAVPGDRFTYVAPSSTLWAWGITAPKGGMVWVPGNLGGHWWSSDHSSGFCRQDQVPATPVLGGLHAINFSICDPGNIGSSGQAVYDPRINPQFINSTSGHTIPAGTHFVYVPDNAVKSTAIWRLAVNPATETLVDVPELMLPLADIRTLKPNGMAMGPDGNLYVTDLTEMNIRKLTNPNADPRTQTISIVAVTGDGRGANGTIGFAGGQYANRVYISENRAASWFDITSPCALGLTGIPCTTTPIPLPSGAFVAGVAVDPVNNLVYASDSPGGANASIWRHNIVSGATTLFLTGGTVPATGTPNATVWIAQTATRAWDPQWTPGGTGGWAFVFGMAVAPDGSLFITEDHTAGNRGARGTVWNAPFLP